MSEPDIHPRDDLREARRQLRLLRRDPKKNAEKIQLWESIELNVMQWIEVNKPGMVVERCTNDGMGIPIWVPGLYVNPRSILPEDNAPTSAMKVLAAIEHLDTKLPDVPRDRGYYPGDDIEGFDSMRERTAPKRWAWSRQRHQSAVKQVRVHVAAGRMGDALLDVWNIAAYFAALSAQMAVVDGAGRGKRRADKDRHEQFRSYSRRYDSAKSKWGAEVHAEVTRRLKNGEDWSAILDDIAKRPGMPTSKTIATRWVQDQNPHRKPGPRKRKPTPT